MEARSLLDTLVGSSLAEPVAQFLNLYHRYGRTKAKIPIRSGRFSCSCQKRWKWRYEGKLGFQCLVYPLSAFNPNQMTVFLTVFCSWIDVQHDAPLRGCSKDRSRGMISLNLAQNILDSDIPSNYWPVWEDSSKMTVSWLALLHPSVLAAAELLQVTLISKREPST